MKTEFKAEPKAKKYPVTIEPLDAAIMDAIKETCGASYGWQLKGALTVYIKAAREQLERDGFKITEDGVKKAS